MLQLEKEYAAKLRPHYEQRTKMVTHVPQFWLTVVKQQPSRHRAYQCVQFRNHEMTKAIIQEADIAVLEHLTDVDLQPTEDVTSGFDISFVTPSQQSQCSELCPFADILSKRLFHKRQGYQVLPVH